MVWSTRYSLVFLSVSAQPCPAPALSCPSLVLPQTCPAPDLSCPRLVLPQTCPAPDLSCPRLVLPQTCPAPDLSCPRLVLPQTCPAPDLSCPRLVLPQTCPAPALSCILLVCAPWQSNFATACTNSQRRLLSNWGSNLMYNNYLKYFFYSVKTYKHHQAIHWNKRDNFK